MRSRRPSPEHEQAVARRLAALSAQFEAARAAPWDDAPQGGTGAPPGQRTGDVRVGGSPAAVGPEAGTAQAAGTREVVVPWPPLVSEEMPGVAAPRDGEGQTSGVVEVAAPGRHAARRGRTRRVTPPDSRWAPLVEVVGLRAAHLVWVALFAAVALGVTSWWLVRAKESAVVTPVSAPVASPAAATGEPGSEAGVPSAATAAGAAAAASGQSAGEVVVDVTGKVRRPGIVVLPVGSRVVDALEAAGGARRGVDLQPLNLARVLLDGEQIVVGAPAGEVPSGSVPGVAGAAGASPPAGGAPGGLVNLNAAGVAELETLPGVGPVTAAAIVEWRTRHGGFTSVEDLLEVHGIGQVTLERLAPLVTV